MFYNDEFLILIFFQVKPKQEICDDTFQSSQQRKQKDVLDSDEEDASPGMIEVSAKSLQEPAPGNADGRIVISLKSLHQDEPINEPSQSLSQSSNLLGVPQGPPRIVSSQKEAGGALNKTIKTEKLDPVIDEGKMSGNVGIFREICKQRLVEMMGPGSSTSLSSNDRDEMQRAENMMKSSLSRRQERTNHKCEICGEAALGFRHGAYACSGCTNFFASNLSRKDMMYCSFNNDCPMNRENRSKCRSCRMRKCIQVGMKKTSAGPVKNEAFNIIPSNGIVQKKIIGPRSKVPLKPENFACRVCGDEPIGHRYNALVCDSCRNFFYLSTSGTHATNYVCINNNPSGCEINKETRNFCRKCRILKCFDVGMSRDFLGSGPQISKEEACEVCGDQANGKKYGVKTCNFCDAFFYCATTANEVFECKNNDECVISVNTRDNCHKCRIQKCFNVGMVTDPIENSMDLLKCEVCEDEAIGQKFGAIVCNSCFKFFAVVSTINEVLPCFFEDSCKITKYSRSHCKKCRLKKCYKVGMDISKEKASNVPPKCAVCKDLAIGMRYNAMVCGSCKDFFLHSVLGDQFKSYSCSYGNVCVINPSNKKACKKCRIHKCFEVGMKRDEELSPQEKKKKAEYLASLQNQKKIEKSQIRDKTRCEVCGDKAEGFRYNAFTCKACKYFFRSAMKDLRFQNYRCRSEGNCLVEGEMRKKCQRCRIQKCFDVGMKNTVGEPRKVMLMRKKARAIEIDQKLSAFNQDNGDAINENLMSLPFTGLLLDSISSGKIKDTTNSLLDSATHGALSDVIKKEKNPTEMSQSKNSTKDSIKKIDPNIKIKKEKLDTEKDNKIKTSGTLNVKSDSDKKKPVVSENSKTETKESSKDQVSLISL